MDVQVLHYLDVLPLCIELRLQHADPLFKRQYPVRVLVDVLEEEFLLGVQQVNLQALDAFLDLFQREHFVVVFVERDERLRRSVPILLESLHDCFQGVVPPSYLVIVRNIRVLNRPLRPEFTIAIAYFSRPDLLLDRVMLQLAIDCNQPFFFLDPLQPDFCAVALLLNRSDVLTGFLVVEEQLLELLRQVSDLLGHAFEVVDHACLDRNRASAALLESRGVDCLHLGVLDERVDSRLLGLPFRLLVHVAHHCLVRIQA